MPLSLVNAQLLNRASKILPPAQSNNIVKNITNIDSPIIDVAVDTKIPTDILIDTPADEYFSGSTWTLNIVLPQASVYCNNITVGLTQHSRIWPSGKTCTINFLLKDAGGSSSVGRVIATNLITNFSQFYNFLITVGADGKIFIHRYEYTSLSVNQ